MKPDMLQETPRILTVPVCFRTPAQELHAQFLRVYDEALIVVDLTGVDTLDPALLAELAQLRLHRRTKSLLLGRLVVASQNVRNALSAVGFERHWPIFRTVDEAAASFDGPNLYA